MPSCSRLLWAAVRPSSPPCTSAGGGQLASALAVEHHIAQHIALDQHRVEHIVHAGQLVCFGHQTRLYTGGNAAVLAKLHPCDQLDDAAQLASVDDVFNAVLVKGDMLGDVVFYGKGAGKLPTASAVVADVVDALKNGAQVHDSLFWQPADPVDGMLTDPAPAAYYVRVAGIAPAVVEAIYGYGKVVDERYEGCAYFVERADERALAEAARKVEAVGGSVKLVLKRLPEEV